MTRELTPTERGLAFLLCYHIRLHSLLPVGDFCDECRADIVRLVDASPSETTGGGNGLIAQMQQRPDFGATVPPEAEREGDCGVGGGLCEDFAEVVERARQRQSCLACGTNDAEISTRHMVFPVYICARCIAMLRPSAPPAGDGVPRVTQLEIEELAERLENANPTYRDTILAALSYCATRQGSAGAP